MPYDNSTILAKRFARDAARGLLTVGNEAVDDAVRLLRKLEEAGAGRVSLGHVRDALTDAFGDIQGAITRALDDEALADDQHKLDLSEWEVPS